MRAGIAEKPEEYWWSSYAAYTGKIGTPRWLTIDWLLRYFGKKPADARKAYRFFVEAGMGMSGEDPLEETTSTLILGSVEFIGEVPKKHLSERKKERDIPALRELAKISLEAITEAVEKAFSGKRLPVRKAAIYIGHHYSGRTLREIGERFGIGQSAVSQASRRFEADIEGNRMLKIKIERIRKTLSL